MNSPKLSHLRHTLREPAKIALLVLLFFGISIYCSYATDSYPFLLNDLQATAKDMLVRNGRPVLAALYALYALSGAPIHCFYYVSSALALLFLGLALWLLSRRLQAYIPGENRRILVSFLSIANLFIIEYFMFIEKGGFMLAILLNTAGACCIEALLRTGKKRYAGFALAAVLGAVFTYQGTAALFVLLCLTFVLHYGQNVKQYLVNLVLVGMIWAASLGLSAAVAGLLHSSRITGGIDWKHNLKNTILGGQYMLLNTFEILPRNLFVLLLAVLLVMCMARALLQKHPAVQLFHIGVICAAACVCSFASILQGSGWYAMRVIYPFAGLPGILLMNLGVNMAETKGRQRLVQLQRLACAAVAAVLLAAQYLSFENVFLDKYRLNLADEVRCQTIGQAIREYRQQTGMEITRIAVYQDASPSYPAYPGLYANGDLVVSSFYTAWSDVNAINYYLGTAYEKADQSEDYTQYFAEKDWSAPSAEQLVFDGDTLHLCNY